MLSLYRGELFGTESLNSYIQAHANGNALERYQAIDGITLFGKVIQYFNRPKSNPVSAYNCTTTKIEDIEVFNSEIGMVKPHGFDKGKLGWSGFRLKHFQVVFSGKENYELLYTGITRAKIHCMLLIQGDIGTLLSMSRPESSKLARINSSLFAFNPLPEAWINLFPWYEEGKVHTTLTQYMVESKSEVIIANLLAACGLTFRYDIPLFAPDGTFYRPDFTIKYAGEDVYWEHLGRLDEARYANHWNTKEAWYDKHFPGQVVQQKTPPLWPQTRVSFSSNGSAVSFRKDLRAEVDGRDDSHFRW